MLYLTLFSLFGALAWLARRYWLLRLGVRSLGAALADRRAFLDADTRRPLLNGSWRTLAEEANSLVQEVGRLKQQRADHLAQLETTLGNLQEAVLIVDLSNYILLANRALRTIFPGARNILGQRLEVVLRSSDFLAYLEEVRAGRSHGQKEIEFVETGKSIWIEATGALVPESGEQDGPWTLFVLHDISRQKQLESVRREFVANVSHELKTPLSVIKGYAETLADDYQTMDCAQREQFIRTILRHAERLSAIVDDLLTLSRLESATIAMHVVVQNLVTFLSANLNEFAERLSASDHRLALLVPDVEILVSIDSLRLTQVLANLFDNAQKYTPRGTRIELGARLIPNEQIVEVWVQDNGPGIPSADLERIFERFYRVEKGRSREKGGTGLGLSIVKHIVQLHGGRIWAESEKGKGTRIVFTLPLYVGPEMSKTPPTRNSASASVHFAELHVDGHSRGES